jgi:ribosome biogenesis GTPase
VTSLVVAGDHVEVERLSSGDVVITGLNDRRSQLSRPGFHGYEHVIAANIDQLVIIQSAAQPSFKRRLVERYLMIARHGGMSPVLVVNKCDLVDRHMVQSWVEPLEAGGMPVLLTSAVTLAGLDALRCCLCGRISVLAGQSGVGKSSLIRALYPDTTVPIGRVNDVTGKGRHTTTSSRLYMMPDGVMLIDTPGVRELALFEDDAKDASSAFPEIETAAHGCRFRDCSHTHEPDCAVKEAVERGDIHRDRYRNYVRLRSRT